MCVCEHYPTLCVSSAASFSQFATSRSWASTFFGSFCASDVGNDDDGGDGGDGGDVGDGVDGGDGGALWIPLYEGFPRLGQYRALPVLLLHLPAHHPLNNQHSTVLAMMVG